MRIIALAFGILATFFTLISTQVKEKKKLMIYLLISYILFSIYFFFNDAVSGALICLLSPIQIIFFNNKKYTTIKKIFFIILSLIISVCTYNNIYSLMPCTCNILFVLMVSSNNMKRIRKINLISRLLWCTYDFISASYLVFISDAISAISIIIAIIRYDLITLRKLILRILKIQKKQLYLNEKN